MPWILFYFFWKYSQETAVFCVLTCKAIIFYLFFVLWTLTSITGFRASFSSISDKEEATDSAQLCAAASIEGILSSWGNVKSTALKVACFVAALLFFFSRQLLWTNWHLLPLPHIPPSVSTDHQFKWVKNASVIVGKRVFPQSLKPVSLNSLLLSNLFLSLCIVSQILQQNVGRSQSSMVTKCINSFILCN